jgi:hypothetical protein
MLPLLLLPLPLLAVERTAAWTRPRGPIFGS